MMVDKLTSVHGMLSYHQSVFFYYNLCADEDPVRSKPVSAQPLLCQTK